MTQGSLLYRASYRKSPSIYSDDGNPPEDEVIEVKKASWTIVVS